MDLHDYIIMVALAVTAGAQAPPRPVSLTASIEPYRVIERGPALLWVQRLRTRQVAQSAL